jgi:hypothetical protein
VEPKALARIGGFAVLLSVALMQGRAAAAVGPFSVAPASGPPGTSVTVSGVGCSPGLSVSQSQDYVSVSMATFTIDAHAPVKAAGSWSTTLVIPANAPAGPITITAACMTDGLPSLVTQYTPQTFTVTAAATTTSTPPTTKAATTSTTAPGGSRGGSSGGGSNPGAAPSVSSPARGSDPSDAPSNSKNGAVKSARGLVSRAADLRVPDVGSDASGHRSGQLGWLWWLLVVGLIGAGVGAWRLARSRMPREVVDGPGAP